MSFSPPSLYFWISKKYLLPTIIIIITYITPSYSYFFTNHDVFPSTINHKLLFSTHHTPLSLLPRWSRIIMRPNKKYSTKHEYYQWDRIYQQKRHIINDSISTNSLISCIHIPRGGDDATKNDKDTISQDNYSSTQNTQSNLDRNANVNSPLSSNIHQNNNTIQLHHIQQKKRRKKRIKGSKSHTIISIQHNTTSTSTHISTSFTTNQSNNTIINQTNATRRKRKNTSMSSKQKTSGDNNNKGSSQSSPVSNAKNSECLRRIKREWKEAVQLGIGYNWITMTTVSNKMKKKKKKQQQQQHNQTSTDDDDTPQHDYVRIGPYGNNLLRWHFSVLGPSNSIYQQGIYHGRVLLPKNYPASPPRVQILTPSGRFLPGEDICLSASSYHPELWTPRWTIVSLIDALRIHMLMTANEIGGMSTSNEVRERLARQSRVWKYGNVDHGRMVKDGLFTPPPSSIEEEKDNQNVNTIVDSTVDEETVQHPSSSTTNPSGSSSNTKKKDSRVDAIECELQQTRIATVVASTSSSKTLQEATEQSIQKRPQMVVILFKVIVEFLGNPVHLIVIMFSSAFVYLNYFGGSSNT